MGEEETVIDAGVALGTATSANMTVKTCENVGYMLFSEYPRDKVIGKIQSFLGSTDGG